MSEQSKHDLEALRLSVDALLDPRRVAACVHACAGLPTEALESGKLGEALKVCADVLWDIGQGETWDRVEDARKALRALGVYP